MASNFIDTLFANGDVRLLIPSGIYVTLLREAVHSGVTGNVYDTALRFFFCCHICGKRPDKRSLANKKDITVCVILGLLVVKLTAGGCCRASDRAITICDTWFVYTYIYIYIYIYIHTQTHTHTIRRKSTCAYLMGFERS